MGYSKQERGGTQTKYKGVAPWLLPVPFLVWYLSSVAIPPEWPLYPMFVLGQAIVSVAFLLWWVRRWKTVFKIHRLLLKLSRSRSGNLWENIRGVVVSKDPDKKVGITSKRPDLAWAYSITRSFSVRSAKRKVPVVWVSVEKAWSFSRIKEGDWVSVWGYWRKGYYRGFWVSRSPRLNPFLIRFLIAFHFGLFVLLALLSVYFTVDAAQRLGLLSGDYLINIFLAVFVHTHIWLLIVIVSFIGVALSMTKNKYHPLKRRRKK